MDLLWSIYEQALNNERQDLNRILAYSSRSGGKTLTSAIMETLFLIHFDRDIVHLAALEAQSRMCMDYVKSYLDKPILRDFKVSDSSRIIKIEKYYNISDPSVILSPVEFKALNDSDKNNYRSKITSCEIVVATLKSVNVKHRPSTCTETN